MTRALLLLVGAAVAGLLVWTAAQVNRESTGGFWAAIAILGLAGLALGLGRLPGVRGSTLRVAPATLIVAFLPALVVAGWVFAAAQPNSSWLADHIESWSDDIGIGPVVEDLATYAPVLACGLGVLLGLGFYRSIAAAPAVAAEPVPSTRAEEPAAIREEARPVEEPGEEPTVVERRP